METWRLLTSWAASPAFNMGLDEALLEAADQPPTLRLYTWAPDTLSLGYFQRTADIPGMQDAGAVVRRITGGGAIHHTDELTFSIAADLNHPLYRGLVSASYERIHGAIARALAGFGIEARMRGENASLDSDRTGTGMCFHDSTPLDLCWGARKGVGSAQRRKATRILHHGSIKIGTSHLEGNIATLSDGAQAPSAQAVGDALCVALAQSFDITFEASTVTAAECERAELLGARYISHDFVHRR